MKKNGVYVEPITPFLEKKELRFGYERMLKKNLSLNIGLGVVLKNEDPGYPEVAREEVSSVFTREGHSELIWILFIPTWETSYSASLPAEESFEEESHYLKAQQFASAELKYFLFTNQKNKLPNGLYAAPGLTAAERFIHPIIILPVPATRSKSLMRSRTLGEYRSLSVGHRRIGPKG
ncbi:MAG: hypothetical protein IPH04_14345 [Saprospirales bacterium]|nr:hypothetical protein [Saprospirales bacterium]